MSRYTGPRLRVMRALGITLPGLSAKTPERRPNRPGQHGQTRPRKPTNYRLQLVEKQKLRFNYGITERQMRRAMAKAKRGKENTGEKLIELLERRLDNVVFRAGLAPTIPAARQLVNHGHFRVNGRRVDVASFLVKPGDILEVRERSRNLEAIETALADAAGSARRPGWLAVEPDARRITVTERPGIESLMVPVEVQAVVEFYAKRL
jgi:small subunit ribosomal protein S4